MTDVVVTEALGELLSPSQVGTYMTCPAKWYFIQGNVLRALLLRVVAWLCPDTALKIELAPCRLQNLALACARQHNEP